MAEPPLPKLTPRKAPVSAAIDVKVTDPTLCEAITRAFRAVDAVHDDGTLDRIPLKSNPKLKGTLACYHRRGFQPLDIEINPHAGGTAFNVLEEIAHFLDHQALGTNGADFASEGHPALKRWRTAASNSMPVKTLFKIAEKAKGSLGMRLKEASSNREIFARSYAQYIALKSGDPTLLAGLKTDRNSPFGDILHWNDVEFKAIMEAFDQLFTDLRWI